MRILRVRRGFSTNCSGANEYMPPEQPLPPPVTFDDDAADGDWSPNPHAKIVFQWVTPMPDGGLPPMLRQALSARSSSGDAGAPDARLGSGDAGVRLASEGPPDAASARAPATVGGATPAERTPASPLWGSSGIGLILFVVVLGVLGFFGLERVTRRLRTRLTEEGDDDRPR